MTGDVLQISKVHTRLFLSKSEESINEVIVQGPGAGKIYEDGSPIDENWGQSDGTVLPYYDFQGNPPDYLINTGLDPSIQVVDELDPPVDALHRQLMAVYRDEICKFLFGADCTGGSSDAAGHTAQSAFTSQLSVSLTGRVQPYLLAPGGLGTGVRADDGEFEQNIPGSAVAIAAGSAGISVEDPIDGIYELSLTALPEEVFRVEMGYGTATTTELENWNGIYHAGVSLLSIVLDSSSSPVLDVVGPLDPPTHVRGERAAGMTRIRWDASSDPLETGYNVYGRPEDQPKYTLLGTTTSTMFLTNHPWVSQDVGTEWQYFVVSKVADGTESLFREFAQNSSPLVANFSVDVTTGGWPLAVTFTDNSLGEVTAREWDFDGDGIVDSMAAEPTFVYTAAGTYTVTLIVGGPEGVDIAIRPSFVTVVDPVCVGVDSSRGMVEACRRRSQVAGVEVDLRHGDFRFRERPVRFQGVQHSEISLPCRHIAARFRHEMRQRPAGTFAGRFQAETDRGARGGGHYAGP